MGLTAGRPTWVVVLIKDFGAAKQRLSPALGPQARSEMARRNAGLALAAARAGDRVLAVCGSPAAAEVARLTGAEVLLEARPAGQNPAARLGLEHARGRGAGAVLLVSSDLPLVTRSALGGMLRAGAALAPPAVLAAPATGRGGTNAIYLAPPEAVGLHFGDDSLMGFEADARARGVRFELWESPPLALDLDAPEDLEALAAMSR